MKTEGSAALPSHNPPRTLRGAFREGGETMIREGSAGTKADERRVLRVEGGCGGGREGGS